MKSKIVKTVIYTAVDEDDNEYPIHKPENLFYMRKLKLKRILK